MASDVPSFFFSYSRDDAQFVLKLASDLRAAGVAVWIDQLDIGAGERWDVAVEQALKASPGLLLVLSPSSVASPNVRDELCFALEANRKVVPVLHQKCDIPFRVRRLQYIDFTADYEQGLERLLQAVKSSRARGGDDPASAGAAPGPPTPARQWILPLIAAFVIVTALAYYFYSTTRRAPESPCQEYARRAVEQNRQATAVGCNVSGPRWHADHDVHFQWCRVAPPAVADAEESARRTELSTCAGKK